MRNKRDVSANNGVSVSYRVDVNERIKLPFFNEVLLTLLAMLASVGAIMTFATILNFTVTPGIVIPFIAVFSVAYTVLYKLVKKRRALVIVGAVVLAGLVVLLSFENVSKGAVIIFDQSKATISKFMYWEAVEPTYKWQDDYVYLTNTVAVLLSMVLCSAISYFTVVKQSFVAIFLLTFPFFEIGAAFGAVPDYLYFSLMLASWAAALTVSRAANAKIKTRRSNGEKKKERAGGNRRNFAGVAVVAAVPVVALFSGITAYLGEVGFSRAENIDKLRHDTKYAFADFVDYITGKDHDGSLKEGKLYEVENRVVKNRHYITMETTIASTKEPIKLKGYTATVYKDNCWNQTDYERYQAMFDEFAESAYMMGDGTGRLITSNPKFTGDFFSDITLSNFRRKKAYTYATYYASFTADFTSVYDSYVTPIDNARYTYPAYLSESYLYLVADSAMYKTADYQAAFAKYKDFVNKEYIKSEIPESVRALAMSFEASNKFEYLNAIRPFLKQTIEHTEKSGKCPEDVDFVENVLFNTKAGYSTHFATVAAVLLQARGYPARYVEGYYIPAEVFNNVDSDRVLGYKTIDITDAYAHAWVEVFDDVYGWIPVEVTPGCWSGDFGMSRPPEPDKPDPETPQEQPEEQRPTDFEIIEDKVDNEVAEEPFEPKSMLWLWWLVPIVLGAAVAAFCVYRLVVAVSKRRMYASHDVDKKLKFAYKWLVSLAAYQKIPAGNIYDHARFAERVSGTGRYITAESVECMLNVFLKHAYSRTPATLEEANEVLSGLRDYSRAIYASLSKPKKWAYKHLRNLY